MLENMREIGRIKLVQVQRSTLKLGTRLQTYYDPTPLLIVEGLLLSSNGVIGVTSDGKHIMDIHHMQHPETHNNGGKNGISIGFTSHYQNMRSRLNPQLEDGCAGENILVETDQTFTRADLGKEIAIQSSDTGQVVDLIRLKVAAPCIEFSQFAANAGMPLPPEQLKETLQFLDNGQRGFYASIADSQGQVRVQTGDKVFVAE